jgi:hypothetical protein
MFCLNFVNVIIEFSGGTYTVHSTYASILKNIYKKVKNIVGIG